MILHSLIIAVPGLSSGFTSRCIMSRQALSAAVPAASRFLAYFEIETRFWTVKSVVLFSVAGDHMPAARQNQPVGRISLFAEAMEGTRENMTRIKNLFTVEFIFI